MKPQDLVVMKENAVQVAAVLRGDFDTEIKELKKAIVEWDKRDSLTKAKKEVEEGRALVDKAKADVDRQAAEHTQRLNAVSDELAAKEAALKVREDALAKGQAELTHAINEFDQRQLEASANLNTLNADLALKQKSAQELLDDLTARLAAVTEREGKVKEALQHVGALVH